MQIFRFAHVLTVERSIFNVFIRKCATNRSNFVENVESVGEKASKQRVKQKKEKMAAGIRVFNVAEKNDVAKGIAEILSNGRYQRRESFSKFNKIYEFDLNLNIFNNQNVLKMTVTSVSGHLLNYEFVNNNKNWSSTPIAPLFDAPVHKVCLEKTAQNIKRTLESEAKKAQHLIIWTDCDREGENIGFEILGVCQKINRQLIIHRARFSEITRAAINRAVRNLVAPDRFVNDAVECRQELDLRIGAAFTRFQTLLCQKKFPEKLRDMLISYGSCQFPTLGFVVERYKLNENFVTEPFWKLIVEHRKMIHNDHGDNKEIRVEFNWARVKLFDKQACETLHLICNDNPTAKVEKVTKKQKSKRRPVALETITLEKIASKKLRINAKRMMDVAQRLYTKGFISYPRTETNKFPNNMNLRDLVQLQVADHNWGAFAGRILDAGPRPHNGQKTDEAHPPIHPIRYAAPMELQNEERSVYEYVVRHFLACLSEDARGFETIVDIDVAGEKFSANGLIITERNYLEVYPYETWSDKELPDYLEGETFQPTSINMNESKTTPPALLTEADLISLMEKHGIGTDATHAEHIEKIKDRRYVALNETNRFVPGFLGLGLVEGYDAMGYQMSKPNLRAELERALVQICEQTRRKDDVLKEQIAKYRATFNRAYEESMRLIEKLSVYFGSGGNNGNGHNGGNNGPPGFSTATNQQNSAVDPGRNFGNNGGNNRDFRGANNFLHGNDDDDDDPDNRGPPPGGAGVMRNTTNNNYNTRNTTERAGGMDNRFLCHCGHEPQEFTVKKAGPNRGRKFFCCSSNDGARCNFFLWSTKPVVDNDGGGSTADTGTGGWQQDFKGGGRKKFGGNSAKTGGSGGNFQTSEYFPVSVKWAGKNNNGRNNENRRKFNSRSNQKRKWSSNFNDSNDRNNDGGSGHSNNKGAGARKCSICRQSGHFANRCPRTL